MSCTHITHHDIHHTTQQNLIEITCCGHLLLGCLLREARRVSLAQSHDLDVHLRAQLLPVLLPLPDEPGLLGTDRLADGTGCLLCRCLMALHPGVITVGLEQFLLRQLLALCQTVFTKNRFSEYSISNF